MTTPRSWYPVLAYLLVLAAVALIGPQLHFVSPWRDQIQGLCAAVALVCLSRLVDSRYGVVRWLFVGASVAFAIAGLVATLSAPAAVLGVLLVTGGALAWFSASRQREAATDSSR